MSSNRQTAVALCSHNNYIKTPFTVCSKIHIFGFFKQFIRVA